MGISWYWLVIFSFAAILPALVAGVVLFLRLEAIRGDAHTAEHKIALQTKDYQAIIMQHQSLLDKVAVVEVGLHALTQRANNIDESFVSLSNKWNSRERAEKLAEKRRRKEEESEVTSQVPEPYPIPGTEQTTLPFYPQQQPVTPPIKRRKFGEMP